MKRLILLLAGVLLLGCSWKPNDDRSGVTSTGNTGEIAGVVVDSVPNRLAKVALLNRVYAVDSARVILYNSKGKIQDTTRSAHDGSFRFPKLAEGKYRILAIFQTDTARLENIDLPDSGLYRAQMNLKGPSTEQSSDMLRPGIFAVEDTTVVQTVNLTYRLDPVTGALHLRRTSIPACAGAGLIMDTATWQNTLSIPMRTFSSDACGGFDFFSTSDTIAGNSWFFNGDLLTSPQVQNPVGACPGYLALMPEMRLLNLPSLEFHFGDSTLQAVMRSDSWCMLRDTPMRQMLQEQWGADFAIVEQVDCENLLVSYKNVQYGIRVIWADFWSRQSIYEISRNGNKCEWRDGCSEGCSFESLN